MGRMLKKKVAGIILAAGTSSRMGTTKQLLPFGGTTVLGAVVHSALASDLDRVILVLGHDAEKIKANPALQIDLKKLWIVINPSYKKGQSTSLVAGISRLPDDIAGAMFLLGDQPLISADIINHLAETYKNAAPSIVIPFYKGRRGNPVIIGKKHFPGLKTLNADTGARVIFKKFPNDILKVPVTDPAVLADVDTPADYHELINRKT